MSTARLIIDPPAAGTWNMAVDETLLQSAGESGQTTLRFYTWKDATLSLGYFQSHEQRSEHTASASCPMVRRATGGGAIVHHHELTYSFVAPLTDRLSANAEALYNAFHETLIDTLGVFGVAAHLCESPVRHDRGRDPFLCFQRRAKGDILYGDAKITGSAQRRHYGAVLQHGSILLMRSNHAPELPGVAELAGRVIATPELVAAWKPSLARRLELAFDPGELSAAEQSAAQAIEIDKFASDVWTRRR